MSPSATSGVAGADSRLRAAQLALGGLAGLFVSGLPLDLVELVGGLQPLAQVVALQVPGQLLHVLGFGGLRPGVGLVAGGGFLLQRAAGGLAGLLVAGLPLALGFTVTTIYAQLDIVLLQVFKNFQMVGWYSAANKYVDAVAWIPMGRPAEVDEVAAGRSYVITKRGRPTAVIMPVEEAEGDLVERGLSSGDLGEYVYAVAIVLDHPLDPADLALDAPQARQQILLGRRVSPGGLSGPHRQ